METLEKRLYRSAEVMENYGSHFQDGFLCMYQPASTVQSVDFWQNQSHQLDQESFMVKIKAKAITQ